MKFRHDALDTALAAGDRLKALETECTEERRLSADTAKILRDAGIMRLIQPKRYGGFEADPGVFNTAMYELARLSSSAGWVTGVVGVHSWHLGLFPDRARRTCGERIPTRGSVRPTVRPAPPKLCRAATN